MTHLTRDELVRWHEQGAREDRDRVVTHLASCADCRGAYAQLVRISASLDMPRDEDVSAFARRGLETYDTRNPRSQWRQRMLWLGIPAAAAAMIILAVNVRRADAPLSEPSGDVRGYAIVAEAPAGDVTRADAFQWRTSVTAARYRVIVRDSGGRQVLTGETERSPLASAPLKPGLYSWSVEALDASGQQIAASRPQAFQVR